ncbi:NAD(P)/FAD-dependent oxidoreductase [Streptomyces platensis]|uniref:NAD(P)/FAD-dependent oxidoreductase n=1 Tax=Streptomyces platensis TaxID=58346 RepID=UPI00386825C9|nr:FAD-binding oxidoreductase [Streptomyces platensis]
MTQSVARADVAVVGSGIIGLATAERLTARQLSVVLVDDSGIAGGATGASGGLIRAFDPAQDHVSWAAQGLELYLRRGWRGTWPQVHEHGSLTLLRSADLIRHSAQTSALRAAGHDLALLSADDMRTRFPGLDVPDDLAGVYEPRGGWLPARQVAHALLCDAGPRLRVLRARATAVRTAGSRVTGVATNVGSVQARAVLLAAGAGSSPLAASVGVSLPLRTRSVAYGLFDPGISAPNAALPTIVDVTTGAWVRRWDTHPTLLAGVRSSATDVPETVRTGISAPEEERIRGVLRRRVPCLADAPAVGGRTAYDAQALAGGGAVTAWPEPRGLVTATGWNGGGFKLAPAAGAHTAARLQEVLT